MRAVLTSIFLREKRLKYLETYCMTMAPLERADANKLKSAMDEYYKLLFPEDKTTERFEKRAGDILSRWIKTSVELEPNERGEFKLHLGAK